MTDWVDETSVRFVLAMVVAGGIAVAGWRRRALAGSGAVAAWVVGVAIVGFGGWWWGMVVVTFFVSSSLLSALIRPAPTTVSPHPTGTSTWSHSTGATPGAKPTRHIGPPRSRAAALPMMTPDARSGPGTSRPTTEPSQGGSSPGQRCDQDIAWLSDSLSARGDDPEPVTLAQRAAPDRTWRQVVANGGVATLITTLAAPTSSSWPLEIVPGPSGALAAAPWPDGIAFVAFAGAISAATADTWATEIGTRSHAPPRRLGFGPPVPPGVSGGMTRLGTGAALAGAVFLASVAALIGPAAAATDGGPSPVRTFLAVAIGGLAGALVDTLLGGTVQAAYAATVVDETTVTEATDDEIRLGHRGHLVRGRSWATNDAVNLAATTVGAVVAAALAQN
ncbi:MAG: hypothetical protein AVDCRST_MAG70-1094 [uncultured Thermomicrobiales bacterium]|uniref:DUF92 domain-containing protein n=1 Tax=uncultured Thermomicrobiales bacterium TaxID=1645740 RepID=A0A6J4UM47_9BACT|nr:MAG: hypothetical protein AVDCRST_MAG70-1094 [uncultured Thermomicrobiales bacterium]